MNVKKDWSNKHILVVEDEGIVAQEIKSRLEKSGYTICDVAHDGSTAIARAEALRPDLVLMDINMPLVNGYEIINRCFDEALARHPNLVAFGEDVGQLGDVNQGFMGLQEKYGDLRVADTGTGIAEKDLPHIFEPFFTTKKFGNQGLGLAKVISIMNDHNGGVQVKSVKGKGTDFS